MIGETLREFRKESKLTQKEVAKKTGFSRSGILAMERGYNTPSFNTVEKYLNAVGYRIKFERIK